jgi:hypothetical protein
MLEFMVKRDEVSTHLLSSLTQEPIEPYLANGPSTVFSLASIKGISCS